MDFVIGFSGTRNGMTREQRERVHALLAVLGEQAQSEGRTVVGLHGDCVGADAHFDAICRELGIATNCRPCTLGDMRARTGAHEIAPEEAPMQRNRAIVADVLARGGVLIACPPNYTSIRSGSGTWATFRFAERAGVRRILVFPDGLTHEFENAKGYQICPSAKREQD